MELLREDASEVIPPRCRFFTLAFDDTAPIAFGELPPARQSESELSLRSLTRHLRQSENKFSLHSLNRSVAFGEFASVAFILHSSLFILHLKCLPLQAFLTNRTP